jgi:hypothetical protein
MSPLFIMLMFLALALMLGSAFMSLDGLALTRSSTRDGISPEEFCTQRCRVNGKCPLTRTNERGVECPLWRYLDEGAPELLYRPTQIALP